LNQQALPCLPLAFWKNIIGDIQGHVFAGHLESMMHTGSAAAGFMQVQNWDNPPTAAASTHLSVPPSTQGFETYNIHHILMDPPC
jgi:hypothetical protein